MKYIRFFSVSFIITILILSTSLPYQAIAQKGGPDVIPGRYIVILEDGVTPQDVTRGHGVVPDVVYSHALNGFSGPISPVALAKLQQDSRVLHIEQDQKMYVSAQTLPTGIDRIDAEPSSPGYSYAGLVTIAIIDTGIDFDHPDLNVVKKVNCVGKNWRSSNCSEGTGDDGYGHGSHVAGTVAAKDNNIGPVGIVPGADLVAVKVLNDNGSGYNSWVIAGIEYVTSTRTNGDPNDDVDVANMSLGGGYSQALNNAVENSISAGIVYAVAAGNESRNAANYSPASAPNAITVSAIADSNGMCGGDGTSTSYGTDDTLATFSNYGSLVDIAAPGVSIYSTYKNGGYATSSGTSMASPHVAGAAALIVANNPNFTPSQVLATLLNNSVPQGQACNGDGDGGFSESTGDGSPEPLVYVGNSVTPIVDETGPTPVITTSETSPTNAVLVPFTIDFGEAIEVSTFESTDISAPGGSVQNLINTGNNQNWTFEVANTVDPSTLSVSISSNLLTDAIGNPNFASNIVYINIDRTASDAPSIDSPIPPTTDNTPTITGTGVSGETITLTSNLNGNIGSSTIISGNWAITTSTLQVGSHFLSATQTDSAGNVSPSSGSVNLVVEALPGVTIEDISPSSESKGNSYPLTITGNGFVSGASITLSNGSGPTPTVSGEVVSLDGTTITAIISIKNGGPPDGSSWDVTVSNPNSSSDTKVDGFTVTP
ncbi:MAG: S8 family serine peptidase [Nitrosopumilus sp.]|nr:S8 family serine peptidase [Nitrosopumilus sp.]